MSRAAARAALAVLLLLARPAAGDGEPVPRIANGLPATGWPEVAALVTSDGTTCTATLVGCRTAVTAAHCACSASGTGAPCPGGGALLDPNDVVVIAPQAGVLRVGALAVPPYFDFGVRGDLAVLDLAFPVRGVRPRAINELAQPPLGTSAAIVGYGRSFEAALDAGILRAGAVVTASCPFPVSNAENVCWSFLHPLGLPGTDSNTCPGDSGGPLLADLGEGLALIGVHSGGFGASCENDDTSFDTSLFAERSWLRAQAGLDLDASACGDGPQVGEPGVITLDFSGVAPTTPSVSFQVPAATKLLRVGLTAENAGDVDLYLRSGAPPSPPSTFTCSSAYAGSFEYCEVPDPQPGTWYALANLAFGSASDYQLTATLLPENPAPPPLASGTIVTANFSSLELVQLDLASGDRAIASSSLRGAGPDLNAPEGIALDRDGSLLLANPFERNVLRIDPATGDRAVASGCLDASCASSIGAGPAFFAPRFVALAADGSLLVADRSDPGVYAIVRIDLASGARTVVSGCANAACTSVVGAGPAIGRLFGIAVEPSGSIVVADGLAVFRVDPVSGDRTRFSGCPGAACAAPIGAGPTFGQPVDIAVAPSGLLYVTYQIEGAPFGALRTVHPVSGTRTLVSGCEDAGCTTLRGAGPPFDNLFGVAFDRVGTLLVTDGELDAVLRVDPVSGDRTLVSGCGDAACESVRGAGAELGEPLDIAVIPEPAALAGGAAALGALLTARRRRLNRRAGFPAVSTRP